MRLGTGAARDGLYGFINSSQCGTLDVRCNAGSSPAHACGGNVYILYLQNQKKKKNHKELEYTNSHCSREGIKKNKPVQLNSISLSAVLSPTNCASDFHLLYTNLLSTQFGYNKPLKPSA